MAQENYIGRRKTSTARLYIKEGSGNFIVNGKTIDEHFNTQARINIARLPIEVTELDGKYDIKVTVKGGGVTGHAGAISLALARALDDLNEGVHGVLKEHGLLTRDDRMVERKKYGQPKARKKFQFSKR
ncbi:30S ribosomal protein S9 [Rhodohalobacter barkolensis]|uniref:Small ribosomal subunit protein uS9 n=1 Tax=Rhodohalobacter barkolensis TaxID=2053187 RepID=A0A2N0VFB7_9BACT|nr:30S ribosomal protein S9 [Rhodohalobacter barkolensis]PKD42883.1 30S ribosomal protein S9 [Rhodohalobacter barkolensis]